MKDNEDVEKMIINGRSPHMRHVSRTNRVDLNWLFDRINVISNISVTHVHTNKRIADIKTKGSFTLDVLKVVCIECRMVIAPLTNARRAAQRIAPHLSHGASAMS